MKSEKLLGGRSAIGHKEHMTKLYADTLRTILEKLDNMLEAIQRLAGCGIVIERSYYWPGDVVSVVVADLNEYRAVRRALDCKFTFSGTTIDEEKKNHIFVTTIPDLYPDIRIRLSRKLRRKDKCKIKTVTSKIKQLV